MSTNERISAAHERELVSRLLVERAHCWPEDMEKADAYFEVLHEVACHADPADVIDTLTRWLIAELTRDGRSATVAVDRLVNGVARAEMHRNAENGNGER